MMPSLFRRSGAGKTSLRVPRRDETSVVEGTEDKSASEDPSAAGAAPYVGRDIEGNVLFPSGGSSQLAITIHDDLSGQTDISKSIGPRWLIRQLVAGAGDFFRFSSDFNYVRLPRPEINADVITTETKDQEIILSSSGGVVRFLFHTHKWCGSVEVEFRGNKKSVSLYSSEHGYRWVDVDTADGGEVRILTGCSRDSDALADQVWLVAVCFSQRQSWDAVSQPASPYCNLTHGLYGDFLTLQTDTVIGASITKIGLWAKDDVEMFVGFLKHGMTVLDIGANIGHHTVVYSKCVGIEGRVIAFEPQSTIFRLLAANTVLNGCANTTIIQGCVGDVEGRVTLFPVDYTSPNNYGALGIDPVSRDNGGGRGEICRVATLDQLISELVMPITRCDFIKIDVQTYELFVLRGGLNVLRRFRPIIFLEISPYWMQKYYDYTEIYKLLFELGYNVTHPKYPSVAAGEIKMWSGNKGEEWDILATPEI